MSIQPDHKALVFCATVAILGVGVRVVRAATHTAAPTVQPSLERQVQAADSSAQAGRRAKGRGKRKGTRAPSRRQKDSLTQHGRLVAAPVSAGLLPSHSGHLGTKLDLDVATAAQLDSLPGVTPKMAKRIVVDRMIHGPFLNRDGLRRVPRVSQRFLARIDSLVAFSGTLVRPEIADTIIPRPAKRRKPRIRGRPPALY